MNLHPAKKHESITIVLAPFDQYSAFARAIEAILKHTRAPFELIILEGGAPQSIRQQIESRKKNLKHVKVIYSNHRPRMAEAFNIALPHIRTQRAFFTHNNLRVTPHWLENLLAYAKSRPGVACPFVTPLHADLSRHFELDYPVTYAKDHGQSRSSHEVDMHGFLIEKSLLSSIGEFDEKVGTPLVGVDLSQHLKRLDVPVHRDPFTVLEYESSNIRKSFDINMFHHQWDEHHAQESLRYLNKKWGLHLQEASYLEWLEKKRLLLRKRLTAMPSLTWEDPFLSLEFPKIGLKKFLQVLTRA